VRLPATAPIPFSIDDLRLTICCASRESVRLRVSTRPSLQNSAYSGQHGGSPEVIKSVYAWRMGVVLEQKEKIEV